MTIELFLSLTKRMTSDPKVGGLSSLCFQFLGNIKDCVHDGLERICPVVCQTLIAVLRCWVREEGFVKSLVDLAVQILPSIHALNTRVEQVFI